MLFGVLIDIWVLQSQTFSFFGVWINFDNGSAISSPVLCLGSVHPSLPPHSHCHPVLSNCPQKDLMSENVILFLSPAGFWIIIMYCYMTSLPPPTPPNIITNRAAIHQSYLCINAWKPKGRKFDFWRRDFKVLVSFA